jgi:hypothetical protein
MTKADLKSRIQQALKDAPHRESIQRLSLFGSRAYGTPREDSDVDLLVEFTPEARIGLLAICGLQNYFKDRLHRKVDLRTLGCLHKNFRQDVLNKSELIYEK